MKKRIKMAILGGLLSCILPMNAWTQERADRPNFDIVKALADRLGAGNFSKEAMEAGNQLIAIGEAALPALVDLFKASDDEMYRAGVVSIALNIEGDIRPMIEAVQSELSKDPSEWVGTYWVFMALGRLYTIEPSAARWVAHRTLALEAGRSSQAHLLAVRVLKEWGQPEDIPALERTISARQVFVDEVARQIEIKELPLGAFDGISRYAEEAIIAIKVRENAGPSVASPKVFGSSPSAVLSNGDDLPTDRAASSARTLWSMIAVILVLLAVTVFIIRRR